jgi:RimJ/RimL family protein N-acetyltransferase
MTSKRVYRKTKKISKRNNLSKVISKTLKKSNNLKSVDEKIFLKQLDKLSNVELKQLSQITRDKNIMKHIGTGKIWSLKDLYTFANDEKKESRLSHQKRQYYSMCLINNNKVIGFIAGRKNRKIIPDLKPHDLLLRMFISNDYGGKGYGKLIIKLFIEKYSKMIGNRTATLYSDISSDNLASIKIHEANGFELLKKNVKYTNGKTYLRYIIHV